jgi:uncharacterized protein (DUF849 family)
MRRPDVLKADKVIVTCAVTGSIHTPTMSDALPITPEEIAQASIEAAQAGASVIHLHARNPANGRPTADPDVFMDFLPKIKAGCDAVVNITTGGNPSMTMDERLAAPLRAQPEVCSLNLGSINFVYAQAAGRYSNWKYDWEEQFLLDSEDTVFTNSFKQIERTFRELGEGCGTRFEYECFDIGHLYTLAHFADRGLAKPPFFIQGVFGVLGGIGADLRNVQHMWSMAESLFGDDCAFSAFAAGKNQFTFAAQSLHLGGHVRVGLEDSLYIGRGQLASSNAEQVQKMVEIVRNFGFEPATPDEARQLLQLKGADAVAF